MIIRKKILFIEHGLAFGGALVVVSNIISHINKKKYFPILVTEIDISNLGGNLESIEDHCVIKRKCNYMHRMCWLKHINGYKSKLLKKINIYVWSLYCNVKNIGYMLALINYIRLKKPDLIHINNIFDPANMIAVILMRKKMIVHIHGIVEVSSLQHIMIPFVGKVISISEFIKDDLVKKGVPEDKIILLKNPLTVKPVSSENRIGFIEKYNLNVASKCFAIFGRIVEWKGQKEFIEAAKLVIDEVESAVAFIVGDVSDGDVEYYEELAESIRNTKYEDKIIFTGFCKDVASIYSIMNVVVHASIEPEPFGLVITEAMSYGVPVIASRLGATGEIIDNGVNGYLVNPKDEKQLASKIVHLLRDNDLCKEIGEKAKVDVFSKYCPTKYARDIERVYESILD